MKLLSLILFFAFLLCPAACAEGARQGLILAAHDALPALFPFFVAGGLLVRSGLADTLGRFAAKPLMRLYSLPPETAPPLVLGLTGGYPVGAATVADLLDRGALAPETAARINSFCNCASPGFCIGLVGAGIFGSARTGAVLYGIHAAATLLAGLITARGGAGKPAAAAPHTEKTNMHFSAALCAATQQAAGTALTVTAFLTLFSVLLALLRPLLDLLPYGALLGSGIELTRGLTLLPKLPLSPSARLIAASFLLGFGGLAVQFQVRALLAPYDLPMGRFTLGKLLHGAIAAGLTALLLRLSPEALPALAPAAAPAVHGGRIGLILAALALLFSIWGGKSAKNAI